VSECGSSSYSSTVDRRIDPTIGFDRKVDTVLDAFLVGDVQLNKGGLLALLS
jgi:hypothetical protein